MLSALSRPILSLLVLSLLAGVGASAEAQVLPTSDGRYLASRAVVEDYVVCTVESEMQAVALSRLDSVATAADRAVAAVRHESEALRIAVGACQSRARLTEARIDVVAAEADAQRMRADRASRSASRWRTMATVAGVATLTLGALRALSP